MLAKTVDLSITKIENKMKRKYKSVVILFRCNEWQIGHTIGGLFNQIGSYPTKEAAIDYCQKSMLKYKIIEHGVQV